MSHGARRSRIALVAVVVMGCASPGQERALLLPITDSTRVSTYPVLWYDEGYVWALTALGEPWFPAARVPEGMTIVRLVEMPGLSNQHAVRLMIDGARCVAVTTAATLAEPIWVKDDSLPDTFRGAGFRMGKRLSADSSERPLALCQAALAAADSAVRWGATAGFGESGLDGVTWVIDLLDHDTLRTIGRWSPDSLDGAPVWRAGTAIQRAAGMP